MISRYFSASAFACGLALLGAAPVLAQVATTTTTTTVAPGPLRQGFNAPTGRALVGQLRGSAPARKIPTRKKLSAKQRAAEARRVAKMTPAQRKSLVLKKYAIAPRGWLASYLPADRYKFGKAWQYVSTETDKYYYRPQDMPRKNFNANRVIGFRSWQLAMLAGYAPDPVSKPAPGAQIVALSRYARGPNFYRFVEYVYAGQVSPNQFEASYTYAQRVTGALMASTEGRRYVSNTLDRVFLASITGDTSVIPRTVGGPPPAPAAVAGAQGGAGEGAMGAPPAFPNTGNVTAPPANATANPDQGDTGGDRRVGEFNGFSQRAANLARRPVPPMQ